MYKKRGQLICTEKVREDLVNISKSKTAEARKVQRAKIFLLYMEGVSIPEIGKKVGLSKVSIYECIDKALAFGAITALDDLAGRGVHAKITSEDKAWVTSVACQSPGDFGYAHETWTFSLLASHISKNCELNGHPTLNKAGKSLIYNILNEVAIKPYKIQYYLEKRDEHFEEKMAQVLTVYKDVAIINKNEEKEREVNKNGEIKSDETQPKQSAERKSTTISYDEKPGIQALKNIGAQLLPVPGKHATVSRDYEYKRLGTLSLLAGIDLHSGNVIPLVTKQHRSEEFIQFLKKTEESYPPDWKIRIILDNHSAHRSKETMTYLATIPGKFELIFTPTHGSWLNMIEMFFSKVARSFLRHIRVNTIEELEKRIYLGLDLINKEPVVFRWTYKIEDSVIKNE